MSDNDDVKAFRRSGQTGRARAITPPTTAEKAREAVNEARQKLPRGSSDTFEVRRARRGGRA